MESLTGKAAKIGCGLESPPDWLAGIPGIYFPIPFLCSNLLPAMESCALAPGGPPPFRSGILPEGGSQPVVMVMVIGMHVHALSEMSAISADGNLCLQMCLCANASNACVQELLVVLVFSDFYCFDTEARELVHGFRVSESE
ncbi:hypothetical protein AXG93_725s1270 [Marchantia polymorpha subsp. ruderalis]|uniref:Uncharacterized protein n=1 Tax=Marchantia polymorpha subsp. ruderalis TaxID=1480154 RepID=A0A176WE86_MARPO|nr:hypothetical protein AXG93_725s1270 [Marchantia polymorpha subsp. ruderalis]